MTSLNCISSVPSRARASVLVPALRPPEPRPRSHVLHAPDGPCRFLLRPGAALILIRCVATKSHNCWSRIKVMSTHKLVSGPYTFMAAGLRGTMQRRCAGCGRLPTRAVPQGNGKSASCMSAGHVVARDVAEAVRWWRKSAEQGAGRRRGSVQLRTGLRLRDHRATRFCPNASLDVAGRCRWF